MALKVVIMAGGRGERFWPQSRRDLPKQFLPLISEKTMIEETANRFSETVSVDNLFISSGEVFRPLLKKIFPHLNERQFLLEPEGRDTAACIGLCLYGIEAKDEDTVLFVPADQFIENRANFLNNLLEGEKFICQREGLLLIGIRPSEPATGFGYIELGERLSYPHADIHVVASFKEKPDRKTAEAYLEAGGYFWNAGMFMSQVGYLRTQFQAHAPDHYQKIAEYLKAYKNDSAEAGAIFSSINKISFDYAVVEKLNTVYCLKADFLWDDVGSWNALARVQGVGSHENLLRGRVEVQDCEGVTCYNKTDVPVVLNGLRDVNVALEKDVIYITDKKKEGNVKTLIKETGHKYPDLL